MGWLSYSDDEVVDFHPAFENVATSCLNDLGISGRYEWVHHDSSAIGGVPDYVLREIDTKRWVLVVEIKKTRAAVTSSTQYRRQAHSYALENKSRFGVTLPMLYCLTNLEQTQLFGANDHQDLAVSPNARQIQNWNHGDFRTTDIIDHIQQFSSDLRELINFSISARRPLTFQLNFPAAWDALASAGIQAGTFLPANWSGGVVGAWFSSLTESESRGLLLAVQCILAEWIVYQSEQHGHPNKAGLTRLNRGNSDRRNRNQLANVIERILQIDFEDVLGGPAAPAAIRGINDPRVLAALSLIVGELQNIQLDQLRGLVGDSGLPDLLFEQLQDHVRRSRRGTVQTDPELAQVAAELVLYGRPPSGVIIDPCAGIGNLLTAAYRARQSLTHSENIQSLVAIEIEPIQSALAALQLMMQAPSAASKLDRPSVTCDSLSNQTAQIGNADFVLLNPPYKRYEDDNDPLPSGYRTLLEQAIESVKGSPAVTTRGQADLYNFYVELVISSMRDGSRGVFILNNKWFNTKTTHRLRRFLLDECTLEAIVQYPQGDFFREHMIATSILIFTKGVPAHDPDVHLIRCCEDLRTISTDDVVEAAHNGKSTSRIKVASHPHSELKNYTDRTSGGTWRQFFSPPDCISVLSAFPLLVDHFEAVTQGRLERDEVSKVTSFPFRNWEIKGTRGQNVPSLAFLPGSNREGPKGQVLPNSTLRKITEAAADIPPEYRGYALKVANRMGDPLSFVLTPANYSHTYEGGFSDAILEPPDLRAGAWARGTRKARWNKDFDASLQAMRMHPKVGRYINLIENEVGLSNRPSDVTWEDLLRPCAGELILVRAFRNSWRAHLNPLAFDPTGRQLRVSSNFYSLREISVATESSSCSNREEASRVLLAFLLSSFGQIQFEFFGDNREGLRKCEKTNCIDMVRAPHPATFDISARTRMSSLIDELNCPIYCDSHPHSDPKRRELDFLVGAHLLGLDETDPAVVNLVSSTVEALDDLQRERVG